MCMASYCGGPICLHLLWMDSPFFCYSFPVPRRSGIGGHLLSCWVCGVEYDRLNYPCFVAVWAVCPLAFGYVDMPLVRPLVSSICPAIGFAKHISCSLWCLSILLSPRCLKLSVSSWDGDMTAHSRNREFSSLIFVSCGWRASALISPFLQTLLPYTHCSCVHLWIFIISHSPVALRFHVTSCVQELCYSFMSFSSSFFFHFLLRYPA